MKTKKFYLKDLNCKVLPLVCLYEVGPFFIILGLVQLQSEKDPGLPSELHHRVKLSNYCATFIFTITLLAGHLSFKSETLRHVSHQGTTHSVLLDDYLFLRSNIFAYDLTEKEMLCYVVNIVFFFR